MVDNNKKKYPLTCRVKCIHVDKVRDSKKNLLSKKEMSELVNLYSAIASNTRLKIIFALAKDELCVCDISHVIDLSIPATSHQLKYLHEHKILKYRNDGKMVYYSLNDKRLVKILKENAEFLKSITGR